MTMQPLGIIETHPPMSLKVIRCIPAGWQCNKIIGLSAFIILMRRVEVMGQHAGTEADQPLLVDSLRRRDEVVPRVLIPVQVGGDRVIYAARVEREAAIEPPTINACSVPLPKLP